MVSDGVDREEHDPEDPASSEEEQEFVERTPTKASQHDRVHTAHLHYTLHTRTTVQRCTVRLVALLFMNSYECC